MTTPDLETGVAGRHRQAADFFVRRREPDWTGADERALNAWLAADPAHRAIFDDLSRTALDLRQIRRPRLASDPPPQVAPPGRRAGREGVGAAQAPGRRAWAPALLSAALLLAGGGWYWWETTPGYVLDVATGQGEIREVELPDGSRVSLNGDSTLRVRYYPRRRDTALARGEAFFEVAPDAARPFSVDSGPARVRVVGTAFNVRAGPPRLVVKVRNGLVELRPDRERPDGAVLRLEQGAGVAVDAASGRPEAVATSADTVGDWRHGQLVFRQTPLAEVGAELARYLGQPVQVDAALALLPVSGMAVTSAPRGFLLSLPHLLPVDVQVLPGGGWRIVPRG